MHSRTRPSNNYNAEYAEDAWQKTLEFLRVNLTDSES